MTGTFTQKIVPWQYQDPWVISNTKKDQKLGATDQIVSPLADVIQRTVDKSWQFIILACDGIWDILSNEEAVDFVLQGISKGKDPKQICMEMCDKCLDSMDNTSVILVCFL